MRKRKVVGVEIEQQQMLTPQRAAQPLGVVTAATSYAPGVAGMAGNANRAELLRLRERKTINAMLADMAQATVKGRSAGSGTGTPEDLTAAQLVVLLQTDAAFNEAAQDAVGTILVDSASVDFTYADGTPSITAIVIDDSITNGKIRNSGALSVIGRSANTTGDPADISAVAASDSVLRESGSTIGFGTVATAGIAANAVTNAKLAQMSQTTVKGRASAAGTGDPTDLTATQLNTIIGTVDLTMADTKFVAADKMQARDSGGLQLLDDGGNLGVFIEDGGQVGINTSSPAAHLHVEATAAASAIEEVARFTVSDDATGYMKIVNTTTADATFNPGIETLQAGTGAARFDLVKITTDSGTTPGYILDVRTAAGAAVSTRPIVDYRTFGSSKMIILGTGDVGIGNTSPQAKLHVGAGADAPTTSSATVYASLAGAASVVARNSTDNIEATVTAGTTVVNIGAATNHNVQLLANNAAKVMILATGEVGIGDTTPDGQLDVNQASTTAAIPTLELEQADLSEELINFVATVGTGNPIEAVGAKTLTTTHFVRVAFNGTLRYVPIGTIA